MTLLPGLEVEWVGEPTVVDGVSLAPGDRLTVLDPGRHGVGHVGVLRSGGRLARFLADRASGVVVRTADGEDVRVPSDALRFTWTHPLVPVPDPAPATWWLDQLDELDHTTRGHLPVGAFVPRSLPAVAMVLHPWERRTEHGWQTVRWSEVVAATGAADRAALHEALIDVTYRRAEPLGPDLDLSAFDAPVEGRVDEDTGRALVEVLRAVTTTPDDVLVAVWEGGAAVAPELVPDAARLPTRHRGHLLLGGPLDGVLRSLPPREQEGEPVNGIWWPCDRAWLVHTDVDLPMTHVGGSRELVDALLARPDLEVLRADHDSAANRVPATGRAGD